MHGNAALFAAPKEEDHLKVWPHAIPRKDRPLQPTDFVCERHFETKFWSKSWNDVYKGHVLVSAPRKAVLVKDALPTKFPGCPSYMTKKEKKRKALADRQCPPAAKQHRVTEERPEGSHAAHKDDLSREALQQCTMVSESASGSCAEVAEPETTMTVIKPFEKIFEKTDSVPLPTGAWACHKVEVDGFQAILFTEFHPTRAATTQASVVENDCAYNYYSAPPTHMVSRKVVSIGEDLGVDVALLGKRATLEFLNLSGDVNSVEDV
ncbi:hypothetical protein HPB47_003539 [Ixodes persulcatus]|uniref:Uncharacterized protein n=1 Tax=Ixodes persulcatus TaxID=34615 RepID=A0AC60PI71_IXOPE|nr:hypothetical protein HPB47_003539 [Ixodes persulcatus]